MHDQQWGERFYPDAVPGMLHEKYGKEGRTNATDRCFSLAAFAQAYKTSRLAWAEMVLDDATP